MVNWKKFIDGRSIDCNDLMHEKVDLLLERGVVEPEIVEVDVSTGVSTDISLQKENDNLLAVIEIQCEKIRKLEKHNVVVDSEIECASDQHLNDLIDELLATKTKNVELQLEMDVHAEKVLAQDSLFKGKAVMAESGQACGNQSKNAGTILEYVQPTEAEGVKCVEFSLDEARGRVMEAGPWYFDNRPVIVKLWSPDVSLERDGMSTVPIWIKLPKIRIGDVYPQSVLLKDRNGGQFKRVIDYEWVPVHYPIIVNSHGKEEQQRQIDEMVQVQLNNSFQELMNRDEMVNVGHNQEPEYANVEVPSRTDDNYS
ncbi:hypothetical protein LguiA_002528 [Lonicera macranthoides]